MMDQPLGVAPCINVRWAEDDPNPGVKRRKEAANTTVVESAADVAPPPPPFAPPCPSSPAGALH